jgi:hypothetical protein
VLTRPEEFGVEQQIAAGRESDRAARQHCDGLRLCVARRGFDSVKILLVHNFYREHGGESAVFEAERRMLRAAGHSVISYTRDSNEIEGFGPWKRATRQPPIARA